MSEIMDATTIGAVFAATVTAHPANPSSPSLRARRAAICPRASRSPMARRAGAPPSCRPPTQMRAMASAIAWRAAREPPRAHPAQARAQCAGRLLRAHQSRLSRGRDGLSDRPQQARSRARARLARGRRCGKPWRKARTRRRVVLDDFAIGLPKAARRARAGTAPPPDTPASILYTSGTTGRPKGCILSHGYEVAVRRLVCGARRPGDVRLGQERIYNPLPLYHVNAGVVSLMGAILTGNGQVQPDRFHPQRWWSEIAETRATVVHYLGIIAPLLLGQPPSAHDRAPRRALRPRRRHRAAAACALRGPLRLPDDRAVGHDRDGARALRQPEPRQVGTRAFGRAVPGIDVRVVDDHDRDVPDGQPGEMLIRHSAATPRRGCFSGYLDDEAATEAAWRGGWFHTGDVVSRSPTACCISSTARRTSSAAPARTSPPPRSRRSCSPTPTWPRPPSWRSRTSCARRRCWPASCCGARCPPAEAADALFRHCNARLAYYKAPGWLHIVEALPTTGTQKIQKHTIFPAGTDPRTAPGIIDLRARKKRA